MKAFFVSIFCCCSLFTSAQSSFTISGFLKGQGAAGKKIILSNSGINVPALDSTVIDAEGRFRLKGSAPTPTMMLLSVKDVKDRQGLYNPTLAFFAENSAIKVDGIYDSLVNELGFVAMYYNDLSPSTTIKGSKSHDLYLKFYTDKSKLDKQRSDAFQAYVRYLNPGKGKVKGPMEEGITITRKINDADKLKKDYSFRYVLANPPSEVLAYIADKTMDKTMTSAEIAQLIAKFEGAQSKGPLTEAF